MGDYPTALNYYQSALENLPGKDSDLKLKGNILNQAGLILNNLRLYNQAIEYTTKSIEIDSILNDSINMMYDLEQLGTLCMHDERLDSANMILHRARNLASYLSLPATMIHDMRLAYVMHQKGLNDSALILIRPTINNVEPLFQLDALSYACCIYMQAGIQDTALMYARQLLDTPVSFNQLAAYQTILAEEMRSFLPADSIVSYALRFRQLTGSFLNQNGNQNAILQNTLYNYRIHERERLKAEEKTRQMQYLIAVAVFITMLLALGLLYMKYRNKSHLLQLHEAINTINNLKIELERLDSEKFIPDHSILQNAPATHSTPKANELRTQLSRQLLELRNNAQISRHLDQNICESPVYKTIIRHIKESKPIPYNSPIWHELEETVAKSSPQFSYRLNILTGGRLKQSSIHLSLLIKCRFSPSNIALLLGRTRGAVSHSREALGIKIFDQKTSLDIVDDIISLL